MQHLDKLGYYEVNGKKYQINKKNLQKKTKKRKINM